MQKFDMQADLALIGRMSESALQQLRSDMETIDFATRGDGSGFEPELTDDTERKFARRQRIPLKRIHAAGDFALFVSLHSGFESERAFVAECMVGQPAELKGSYFESPFCFSGYYAALHDDRHISASRQIMLIAQNGGHRILSEPSGLILCPQAGDILVLNTHVRHGLLPGKGLSVEACRADPLKFFAMSFALSKSAESGVLV